MQNNIRWLSVILICLVLSGCNIIPVKRTLTPHLYGKVIDAGSGKPIEGVEIYFKEFPDKLVLTRQDGIFDLPEVEIAYSVGLFPARRVPLPPPGGNLVVHAEQYQSCEIHLIGGLAEKVKGCNFSYITDFAPIIQIELNRSQ